MYPPVEMLEAPSMMVSSIFDAMTQPPESIAAALEGVVDKAIRDREPFHRVWTECEGMTWHSQWGTYDRTRKVWAPAAPAPSNKVVRLELNHIHGFNQATMALHCAEPQSWGVCARTSELSDEESAKVGQDLIDYYMDRLDHETLRQMQAEQSIVTGTSYVMPYWDTSAGRTVQTLFAKPQEASPAFTLTENEVGAPPNDQYEYRNQCEGDLRFKLGSTYEVVVETGSSATKIPMWMAWQEMVPIAEIVSHPGIPEDVKQRLSVQAPYSHNALRYEAERQGMSPRSEQVDSYGGYTGQWGANRESCVVTRMFVRATPQAPLGKEYVFTQGVMLYKGDNPRYPKTNELGEEWPAWPFPIFPFRDYAVTGAWYGQGDVVRAIGPQKTLNASISSEVMFLRRLAGSVLVKPKGVNFQRTDEVDQVIEVPMQLPQGAVYYLPQQQAPQTLQNMEQRQYQIMQHIYGIDDATLGSLPSANVPARGIQQLKQSSIGRRRPIENRWSRQWARVYSYALFLLRRHVVADRMIQIVGSNRKTAMLSFSRAKLASGMDVMVFEDFARPRDPGQRGVWAQTLIGMKLANMDNPDERAEMQRLMGAGSLARFQDRIIQDREKASRENVKMYRGELPIVAYYEKDDEHLAEHFGEMNTEEYETKSTPLPDDPPEVQQQKLKVKAAFEGHCKMHMAQKAQKAGGMPAAGGPPGAMPPGAGPEGAMAPPAGAAPGAPAPEQQMGVAA